MDSLGCVSQEQIESWEGTHVNVIDKSPPPVKVLDKFRLRLSCSSMLTSSCKSMRDIITLLSSRTTRSHGEFIRWPRVYEHKDASFVADNLLINRTRKQVYQKERIKR